MTNSSAIVVGGGIIGTMHALLACEAGYSVIHLERDEKPRAASVRNFGLIWVSGRDAGPELELALRARELWEEIGSKASIGFRANGSLTVAKSESEFEVLKEAVNMPGAEKREFSLLSRDRTLSLEPSLGGDYAGALRCKRDAVVEPSILLEGLRNYLKNFDDYQWIPEFEVKDFYNDESGNHVSDLQGQVYSGDFLAICAGDGHHGFISEFMGDAPLRKVRLQMGATIPVAAKLSHSLADIDSLRYYPAFKNLSLFKLPTQSEIAAKNNMQLLLVQRLDGSMTIGDTHEYDEPFGHEIQEAPYEHLSKVISDIFGTPAPRIERRWVGIYSQSTNNEIYFRKEIAPGAVIVTGGGGRGNTLSPAIAEETIQSWAQLN